MTMEQILCSKDAHPVFCDLIIIDTGKLQVENRNMYMALVFIMWYHQALWGEYMFTKIIHILCQKCQKCQK